MTCVARDGVAELHGVQLVPDAEKIQNAPRRRRHGIQPAARIGELPAFVVEDRLLGPRDLGVPLAVRGTKIRGPLRVREQGNHAAVGHDPDEDARLPGKKRAFDLRAKPLRPKKADLAPRIEVDQLQGKGKFRRDVHRPQGKFRGPAAFVKRIARLRGVERPRNFGHRPLDRGETNHHRAEDPSTETSR